MTYETVQVSLGGRMFVEIDGHDVFPIAMGMGGVDSVEEVVKTAQQRFEVVHAHEPATTIILRSRNIFGVVCV